jgi:hypothetical protein
VTAAPKCTGPDRASRCRCRAWRGRKDVHSGTLCQDPVRVDGGGAEPAAERRRPDLGSPEHDHQDAPVFGSAGLPALRTAGSKNPGPQIAWINTIFEADRGVHKKQRHAAIDFFGGVPRSILYDNPQHLFRPNAIAKAWAKPLAWRCRIGFGSVQELRFLRSLGKEPLNSETSNTGVSSWQGQDQSLVVDRCCRPVPALPSPPSH